MSRTPRVCVVGAGPSGLAALQVLTERGIDAQCFERGPAVGGQWRYENESGSSSTFASLEMMSSRLRSGFKRFKLRPPVHRYPLLPEVQEYLEDFARTYRLFERIQFKQEVVGLEADDRGGWLIATSSGPQGRFSDVIVATGHHSLPHMPEIPAGYTGEVSHSGGYRTPSALRRKHVLIVGFGNSALDIAGELVGVAASVTICSRGTGHLLPKRIAGLPLDWLDTAAASLVPFKARQAALALLLRASRSSWADHGIPRPDHGLLRRIPVTVTDAGRQLASGEIDLRGPLAACDGRTVTFADRTSRHVDHILCATGYEIVFPFLNSSPVDTTGNPLYRRIVSPDLPNLFFAGLIDPNGGLLIVLETQSEWIADVIEGRVKMPPPHLMRAEQLRERRSIERRFVQPGGPATWLLCDRYPYIRRLRRDRSVQRVLGLRSLSL